MKNILTRLTAAIFISGTSLNATESVSLELVQNFVGTVKFQVSEFNPEWPLTPGRLIEKQKITKVDEKDPRWDKKIEYGYYPTPFLHVSVTVDGQVLFSQPVQNATTIGVYSNGNVQIDLNRPLTGDQMPDWLWSTITVTAFDFQGCITKIIENWKEARAWADENHIPQDEIISQYPKARYPDNKDSSKRTELEDLFPSCVHSINSPLKLQSVFSAGFSLSWNAIQTRWMKEHPDFKASPTESEIKLAESQLIAAKYPLFCHQD